MKERCLQFQQGKTQIKVMQLSMSFMRTPAFCICENKDVDQLRSNRTADQRLCFGYIDRTITLMYVLLKR